MQICILFISIAYSNWLYAKMIIPKLAVSSKPVFFS